MPDVNVVDDGRRIGSDDDLNMMIDSMRNRHVHEFLLINTHVRNRYFDDGYDLIPSQPLISKRT